MLRFYQISGTKKWDLTSKSSGSSPMSLNEHFCQWLVNVVQCETLKSHLPPPKPTHICLSLRQVSENVIIQSLWAPVTSNLSSKQLSGLRHFI